MDVVEFLMDTLTLQGGQRYGAEPVNQLQHALQCAALADAEDAPPALLLAALLHDIGHLVHGVDPNGGRRGLDDRHEVTGAALLRRWFGPDVSEPIRLHVPAKRYLCAVDGTYYDGLSAGSKRSLELQGNPYSAEEAARFIDQPYAAEAVRLRVWDDRAKVRDLDVPRLDSYRFQMKRLLAAESIAAGG